ncbi:hypothetical protein P5V15_008294 [Pogonomyrmex californicus]
MKNSGLFYKSRIRFLRSFASLFAVYQTNWTRRDEKTQRLEHFEQRCGHFPFLERKMLPVCTIKTSERTSKGTVYLRDLNMTASSIDTQFKRECIFVDVIFIRIRVHM